MQGKAELLSVMRHTVTTQSMSKTDALHQQRGTNKTIYITIYIKLFHWHHAMLQQQDTLVPLTDTLHISRCLLKHSLECLLIRTL